MNLVKGRGEGVPSLNTKVAINLQVSDEMKRGKCPLKLRESSLYKIPCFHVVYAFCKSRKMVRSNLPRYHAPSEEGDQPCNGIGGTQIGRGINPGCSVSFAPTACKDKSSKRLDENSQAKSDLCLV